MKLDPKRTDIRVEIHASAMTPEVEALLERLSQADPETLLGFREGTAVPLTAADILRFYGEDKDGTGQTGAGRIRPCGSGSTSWSSGLPPNGLPGSPTRKSSISGR